MVEEALARIRAPEPVQRYGEGAIVVISRDGGSERLARVLEVRPSGMTKVQPVDDRGFPTKMGRAGQVSPWMLVPGEILRAAFVAPAVRGLVRYELEAPELRNVS